MMSNGMGRRLAGMMAGVCAAAMALTLGACGEGTVAANNTVKGGQSQDSSSSSTAESGNGSFLTTQDAEKKRAEGGDNPYYALALLEEAVANAGGGCKVGEWEGQTWMSAADAAYCKADDSLALIFNDKSSRDDVLQQLADNEGLDQYTPKAAYGDLWILAGPGQFIDKVAPQLAANKTKAL